MAYSELDLNLIFWKTKGLCACCRGNLDRAHYGRRGPDPWEVAHRQARARGGSDLFPNLWPMHRRCNRAMGTVNAAAFCKGWRWSG